jgi:hypothetical protein
MNFALTVVHPFKTYKRGDQITDPETIQKILASENAAKVVRVAANPSNPG